MSSAERNLKRLHKLLHQKGVEHASSERPLLPRKEVPEDFVEDSLPPLKNRKPRGKKPTFFLSRGEISSKLLKKAYYINQLNRKVIPRLGLPYSSHLRLSSITSSGVAVVHADSPGWAQRGRFLQQNILDLLHQEGVRQVKRVRLKVRFSNAPVEPEAETVKKVPSKIAHKLSDQARHNRGELGDALQRLSNTLLRNRQR